MGKIDDNYEMVRLTETVSEFSSFLTSLAPGACTIKHFKDIFAAVTQ